MKMTGLVDLRSPGATRKGYCVVEVRVDGIETVGSEMLELHSGADFGSQRPNQEAAAG